jgi:hypothetical protein
VKRQVYSGDPTVALPPDSELGEAMLALTPLRRKFVWELACEPSGYGSEVRAARAAGFAGNKDSLWHLRSCTIERCKRRYAKSAHDHVR